MTRKTANAGWFSPVRLGIAALLVVTAVVIYAVWQSNTAQNAKNQPLTGVEQFPNVQQGHQEGQLSYDQTPPAGGVHNSAWQNCGVYIRHEQNPAGPEPGAPCTGGIGTPG